MVLFPFALLYFVPGMFMGTGVLALLFLFVYFLLVLPFLIA